MALGSRATKLADWLTETVGLSISLLKSLDDDDDWTFVIKMHGILEAGLNHLLLSQLGNQNLSQIVSRLETKNARTGKIAFIKAYDLLPHDACLFVQLLSEVRNRAVHDIKNFDLNLKQYLATLDNKQLKNWRTGLTCWCSKPIDESMPRLAIENPRAAIYNSCMRIVVASFSNQIKMETRTELLNAVEGLAKRTDKPDSGSSG